LTGITELRDIWFAVERVMWLRAKARHERWKEEVLIVENEMTWIKLWFKHQIQVWEDRKNRGISEGHRVFAAKQVGVWKTFLSDASRSFREGVLRNTIE
jgi:hypothetical protein